jgi:cyclophilin family peptidyl-prolyl cis-trans isomerase
MALNDYIDKDTRNLILILLGLGIFMFIIFPRIEGQLFTLNLSEPLRPLFPELNSSITVENKPNFSLEEGRDYKLQVNTTAGSFTIDLDEKNAPQNSANLIASVPLYRNSDILVSRDYLFKIDSPAEIRYSVEDEINADFLLLNKIRVREASFLRDAYDPNDPSTNAFSSENLDKYSDFTVKQFYEEILGYNYNSEITSPRATKYIVYMASEGPNQNKIDFFIVMAGNAREIDGRFTPVGRVVEGFTVLDSINKSASGTITVNSVLVK